MNKNYVQETLDVVAKHLDIPVEQIVPTGEQPKDVVVVTGGVQIPTELLLKLPRKNIEE